MALDTLTGLKNSIADWLGQDTLTDKIPAFIDIAEWRISRKIRIRAMELHSSTTITAGDTFVIVPDRFLGIRGIYIDGDPQYKLEFATPEQMNDVANTAGRPKFFNVSGERIRFPGASDATYTIKMNYYARFAPLTNAAPSNWLSENYPLVLLYGALHAAAEYIHDEEQIARWGAAFERALQELQDSDKEERYGPAPVMKTEGHRW